MARSLASRKYLLTMNNPVEHGYTHAHIRELLEGFAGISYWCMCDEIGKEGTPHTHVFLASRNPIMLSTLHLRFYGAHIDFVSGTHQENRDYVRKEGKWLNDEKRDTNLPETFEEYGEMPLNRTKGKSDSEEIYRMIKAGCGNIEILEAYPSAMTRLDRIDQTRQAYLEEQNKNEFRKIDVTYLYGETGVGKTRGVMEKYGYANVYRVTNYQHPFDGYRGQDVLLFEEFRSNLPIGDMLVYLDGYPTQLPCRYADKSACFTKVYIISNIALERQYPTIQLEQCQTWRAFCRRITRVIEKTVEDE